MNKVAICYSTPIWVKTIEDRYIYANQLLETLGDLTRFEADFQVLVGYDEEVMDDVMKSFDGAIYVLDEQFDEKSELHKRDCGESKELDSILRTNTPNCRVRLRAPKTEEMCALVCLGCCVGGCPACILARDYTLEELSTARSLKFWTLGQPGSFGAFITLFTAPCCNDMVIPVCSGPDCGSISLKRFNEGVRPEPIFRQHQPMRFIMY